MKNEKENKSLKKHLQNENKNIKENNDLLETADIDFSDYIFDFDDIEDSENESDKDYENAEKNSEFPGSKWDSNYQEECSEDLDVIWSNNEKINEYNKLFVHFDNRELIFYLKNKVLPIEPKKFCWLITALLVGYKYFDGLFSDKITQTNFLDKKLAKITQLISKLESIKNEINNDENFKFDYYLSKITELIFKDNEISNLKIKEILDKYAFLEKDLLINAIESSIARLKYVSSQIYKINEQQKFLWFYSFYRAIDKENDYEKIIKEYENFKLDIYTDTKLEYQKIYNYNNKLKAIVKELRSELFDHCYEFSINKDDEFFEKYLTEEYEQNMYEYVLPYQVSRKLLISDGVDQFNNKIYIPNETLNTILKHFYYLSILIKKNKDKAINMLNSNYKMVEYSPYFLYVLEIKDLLNADLEKWDANEWFREIIKLEFDNYFDINDYLKNSEIEESSFSKDYQIKFSVMYKEGKIGDILEFWFKWILGINDDLIDEYITKHFSYSFFSKLSLAKDIK